MQSNEPKIESSKAPKTVGELFGIIFGCLFVMLIVGYGWIIEGLDAIKEVNSGQLIFQSGFMQFLYVIFIYAVMLLGAAVFIALLFGIISAIKEFIHRDKISTR